jgi:hypothetical protein
MNTHRWFVMPAVNLLNLIAVAIDVDRWQASQPVQQPALDVYVRGPQKYYDDPDYLSRTFRPE